MRTRTGPMLVVALCTLACEEDEQLLGSKSPARAPGADAAVASTSTVQGVEAGVRDSGLSLQDGRDAALLDASAQLGTKATGPFEGGTPPNEDARATTPAVGQGAQGGTQEVPSGAAEREPDGGVASTATSGAGGAPGVALIDSGADSTEPTPSLAPTGPNVHPPVTDTNPDETSNLPGKAPQTLPEGWIHQLPKGCTEPSPISIGGFVQNAVGCPGYILSASCFIDAEDWLCSGLILPDDSSPGGVATDPSAPLPYPRDSVINYRISGTSDGIEASNVALAVTGMGEQWPLVSEDCTTEVNDDGSECSRAAGCYHLVESDSGTISLWRPTGAGVRCLYKDPIECRCSGSQEVVWEAFLSGVETSQACSVGEAWCNDSPRQVNDSNRVCEVLPTSGGDTTSCRYESYCGGRTALPEGGELRAVAMHTVICETGADNQLTCRCERPDGILRWDPSPLSEGDGCSPNVDACNLPDAPEALAAPNCTTLSQQADAEGCRANLDCRWPVAFADNEMEGYALSALSCERSSDTTWRCLCGTSGDVWNFDVGASAWESCSAAIEHCGDRIASGDISP